MHSWNASSPSRSSQRKNSLTTQASSTFHSRSHSHSHAHAWNVKAPPSIGNCTLSLPLILSLLVLLYYCAEQGFQVRVGRRNLSILTPKRADLCAGLHAILAVHVSDSPECQCSMFNVECSMCSSMFNMHVNVNVNSIIITIIIISNTMFLSRYLTILITSPRFLTSL